jgi:hypothetical protein
MQVTSIELYNLLKSKLGDHEAKALVTFVEHEVENKLEQKKEIFVTVADKEKLLTKADALFLFTTKEDLANTKADLIKWMFIFIMGQMIAQVSIIIALLKVFSH